MYFAQRVRARLRGARALVAGRSRAQFKQCSDWPTHVALACDMPTPWSSFVLNFKTLNDGLSFEAVVVTLPQR